MKQKSTIILIITTISLLSAQQGLIAEHQNPAPLSSPVQPVIKPNIPAYVHPEQMHPVSDRVPGVYENDDAVMALYYNLLYPQEDEFALKRAVSMWCHERGAEFPVSPEDMLGLQSLVSQTAIASLASRFFQQVKLELAKEAPLATAIETAYAFIQEEVLPIYQEKALTIKTLMEKAKPGSLLKERYQLLYNRLMACVNDLPQTLQFHIDKLNSLKNDRVKLEEQFSGLNQKFPTDPLTEGEPVVRPCDRWDHRKKIVYKAIEETLARAPLASYFIGLQEVTARTLLEIKQQFEPSGAQVIAYNNGTGKKFGERLEDQDLRKTERFFSTLVLSKDLKVEREVLSAPLPNNSGTPPRVLAVEVLNEKTGKRFAIFVTHTDYMVKSNDDLYPRTVTAIHAFMNEFLKNNPDLPFFFGGDLNAFEQLKEAPEYITYLRSGPLHGAQDSREGPAFFVADPIVDATFLGLPSDTFKARVIDGRVTPSALDHVFGKNVEVLYGLRNAAVFDEAGELVNPYKDPELYLRMLDKRYTGSDHFMGGMLVRIN